MRRALDIEIVRPQDLSAADEAAWIAFQSACPELDSPFLSPHWARSVERAQAGSAVKVAILREGSRPVGFIAAKTGSAAAMPAGAPMCDYQGIVGEPGLHFDPRDLVEALGVGCLDFSHMLAAQSVFAGHMRGTAPSYLVNLDGGYEAYAAQKRESGSGVLKDLDKRRRKIEREVAAPAFTAFSRSRTDFDQLIAWKREQYRLTGQTDIFQADWTERLLRELFLSRDPTFGGVLYTLHVGDKLAAAHFHLRGQSTIHAWIIGHDAALERYSPGLLLFQNIMRWMDDTPYGALDFGAGDYRFKQQLSNQTRTIAHGFVGRPSPASLMRHAAYGLRAAAESLPLGRVSALPGKAMRRLDVLRALR
jgi:CelD/BcsL family acetyltransferase involved in cellulose biosynthesis